MNETKKEIRIHLLDASLICAEKSEAAYDERIQVLWAIASAIYNAAVEINAAGDISGTLKDTPELKGLDS